MYLGGVILSVKLTKHHRKPRNIGGSDKPINISMVPGDRHEAWHVLFGHNEASIIAVILNEYFLESLKVEAIFLLGKIQPRKIISSIIPNYLSRRKAKREKRLNSLNENWEKMFSGLTEKEIIEEINQVWLDPEYALRVVYEKRIKS